MTALTPPSTLLARFRADLEALAPDPPALALAVSGGPDSLAMLLLASAAYPGRVQAATIDHRLRPESLLEALHVEDICDRLGCPHTILTITVPNGPSGPQAEARAVRYAALTEWAAGLSVGHILTAHHADDQAETLLMRLRRGAGVSGLAGIRPRRRERDITIVRPLLGWTKAELVHVVASAGIEAVDDPSNRDPRFDRTAVRALLRGSEAFDPMALSRSAAALYEADNALAWVADQLWNERVRVVGGVHELDHRELPAELKRRLVLRIFAAFTPSTLRGDAIERLLAALKGDRPATLAGVACRPGATWRFAPAPARRRPKQERFEQP